MELNSWKNDQIKQKILNYLNTITQDGSPDFIPENDRVAVFDNDGTLWCEKPLPMQADFLFRRLGKMIKTDPSLRFRQPWKAVSEKDNRWLSSVITKHYLGDDSDLKAMSAGLLKAFEEVTIEEFEKESHDFLHTQQHPKFHRPYLECIYQPMLELIELLTQRGFKCFIVSGGGRDFVRSVSQEIYDIPPERVVGSAVKLKYVEQGDFVDLIHLPNLDIFDDGEAKPVRIWDRIGKRPVISVGNANGDIPMLNFYQHPKYKSLAMIIDHDDGVREFAYHEQADEALKVAKIRGWIRVSMKDDWSTIFLKQGDLSRGLKQAS